MNKRGLTTQAAEKKLKQYGFNEIKDINKISPFGILLRQVKKNFIIYLLTFAAVISFLVGKSITAYTIIAVIILVIGAGFIQEFRAERSIHALRKMIMPISIVIRDGKEKNIPSKNLVPGDIIILRNGERIPADCVILEEMNLLVDESILTGESKEIKKKPAKNIKKYNEINMVFMGSFVVNGRCVAKITHTGMNTRFGKIAKMISTAEKDLPLQKKVNNIAKFMAIIAIIVSFLTGVFMLLTSQTIDSQLIINIAILVIALTVSAFPEGFPVVLITTLAAGAHRMAKKNAIVNRMSIIETLGETTIICADKTGTITKGEMTVKKIYAGNKMIDVEGAGYETNGKFLHENTDFDMTKNDIFNLLLKSAVICNDSRIERTGEDSEYKITGNPTEASLLIAAAKANIFVEDLIFSRKKEIPFDSIRKMMSVVCKDKGGYNLYAKGAPEVILTKCTFIQKEDGISKLNDDEKNEILRVNKELTSQAYRTIGIAYRKYEYSEKNIVEDNLIFLGIVGMEDPPREEVMESIEVCSNAGIKVKMITGDNKETAIAIANQINLKGKVMEGYEIDKLSDEELNVVVNDIVIFTRVKPEHKLRIVKALKHNGEIVTMTGDGVNDAPALKEAHIGVAMGKNGTDVSRSVADLTLKDDHFSTIVSAIKEGRTIYNNIRKFVTFQLSCNYAELSVIFLGVILSPVLGWGVPLLLALQILFMNIVTDNLPAITLGFNPSSKDIMEEKPRKTMNILNKKYIMLLLFTGMLMTIFVLGTYYLMFNILGFDVITSRTTALVSLIFLEIANAFNFRSFRKGVLNRSPFINKPLVYASAISILATILIIYTPLNNIFEVGHIPLLSWIMVACVTLITIIVFDILKKKDYIRKFLTYN